MLPPSLATSRPSTVPRLIWATPITSTSPSTSPPTAASSRWPRMVSTSESEASTPTSISTNRNSIRIAPV